MRVLGFGTYDVQRHPRVEVLLDGMRAHGLDVSELVRPLGLSTAERVRMLQQPWRVAGLVARVLTRWARLAVAAVPGGPRPDVVGYMGHFDVLLARLLFPRSVVVLDHLVFAATTATDRGTPAGMRTRLLRLLDRAAIAAADVVVVDTDEHRALVPAGRRADAVVAPVGALSSWFAAGAAQASRREAGDTTVEPPYPDAPLTMIFYGLFTPLQGAPVIGRALRLLHDRGIPVRATLVGDGQDAPDVRALVAGLEEVRWLPWVEAQDLPAVVAAHDVCLGIFGNGDKALRVVPNKVYQGAAAGTAVITSDTAPQRRALGDAAVLVTPGDPAALADALADLAGDAEALAAWRSRAARLAGRAFTPAAVAAPVVDALRTRPNRRAGAR